MGRRLRGRTGHQVRMRYPGREMIDVLPEAFSLARRRTEFLHPMAPEHRLDYLLACAWLQGVVDADQALASEKGTGL